MREVGGSIPPVPTLNRFVQKQRFPMTVEPDKLSPLTEQTTEVVSTAASFEWAEEAMRHVRGARQKSYGHPLINFFRISTQWNILIRGKLKAGEYISPADVAVMFLQTKIAREIEAHKADNIVDSFGYLMTYNAVHEAMLRLGYEDGISAFRTMTENEAMELYRRIEQDAEFADRL